MNPENQACDAEFRVGGMDCPTCADKIREALSKLKGVERCDVQFTAEKLSLAYVPNQTTLADIEKRVRDLGYSLEMGERGSPPVHGGWRAGGVRQTSARFHWLWGDLRRNLMVLSAILFVFGFALEWRTAPMSMVRLFYVGALLSGGFYIARSALSAIRYLSIDMSVLMSIAIIGAWGLGEWSEAVMVTVLFTLAQFLESRSMTRARKAITELMNLAPLEASVWRDGKVQTRPVKEIAVGDTILVRPGEHIPLDGVVTHGGSRVNQAPITGESLLVEKNVGSEVYAGTINENGALEIRVTKAAGDTTLARITRQIEIAQAQKARAQQFVDRFAKIYTPCVIGLAILLPFLPWFLWGHPLSAWLRRSLVLLVIACPCALAISTPVAIVSALANAARQGVLIKGGVYLERLGKLKAIAFDKTGTLTRGEPQVKDIIPLNGVSRYAVLQSAVAVESRSEHALARAILRYAQQGPSLPPLPIEVSSGGEEQFTALPGKGVKSTVVGEGGSRVILVGTHRLFIEEGANLTKAEQGKLHQLEADGKIVVLVGFREGEGVMVQGFIAFADQLRQESASVLAALRRVGISHLTMLTGDTHRTASAVAEAVHVTDYRWELLPADKVDAVKQLRQQHGTIAMVGDGINDAPALAMADVGIAMGEIGTDTTLEVADVVLLRDNLSALPFAMRLGQRTLRIIQTNIAFALVTKLIFTLLALNGMATLWMAVFADMGASLLVIFNGLRLLKNK
ncbi:cation-translocating P-type ATPase [Candidatus Poribacteria bacterium]|nr:cation-translocating P-type ATPase [Candidatus Poribacteria bacterium]